MTHSQAEQPIKTKYVGVEPGFIAYLQKSDDYQLDLELRSMILVDNRVGDFIKLAIPDIAGLQSLDRKKKMEVLLACEIIKGKIVDHAPVGVAYHIPYRFANLPLHAMRDEQLMAIQTIVDNYEYADLYLQATLKSHLGKPSLYRRFFGKPYKLTDLPWATIFGLYLFLPKFTAEQVVIQGHP